MQHRWTRQMVFNMPPAQKQVIIDQLVAEELVERVANKPKKPSILDEEWYLDNDWMPNGIIRIKPDGGVATFNDHLQEIAALPDCLRALVEIDLLLKDVQGTYGPLGDINSRRNAVRAALKKAGVS